MLIRILVVFLACFGHSESNHQDQRASLAPCPSEKEAGVQGLHQAGYSRWLGWIEEKEVEQTEKARSASATTPFLEHPLRKSCCSANCYYDVALHTMQDSKFAKCGSMQRLSSTLDSCLGSKQTSLQKCSAEEKTNRSWTSSSFQRQQTGGHPHRLDVVSRESPMDHDHSSDKGAKQRADGSGGRLRATFAAISSASSPTSEARSQGCGCNDGARDHVAHHTQVCQKHRTSIVRSSTTKADRARRERTGTTVSEGIRSWSPEQAEEDEASGDQCGEKDRSAGPRMERFPIENEGQSYPSLPDVPPKQNANDGSIQWEVEGTESDEARSWTSLTAAPRTGSSRNGDCGSHNIHAGGTVASNVATTEWTRSHLHQRGRDGGRNGIADGRRQLCGKEDRTDFQAQSYVQGVHLTKQGGHPTPEGENRKVKCSQHGFPLWEDEVHDWQQGDMNRRSRKVRFDQSLQVIVFLEGLQIVCNQDHIRSKHVDLVESRGWLRTFWHCNGQVCAWDDIAKSFDAPYLFNKCSFHGDENQDQREVEESSLRQVPTPIQPLAHEEGSRKSQENRDDQPAWTFDLSLENRPGSRAKHAQVWFLRRRHMHVCIQSRSIDLQKIQTFAELLDSCKAVWYDMLGDEDEITLDAVHPQPFSVGSRIHLIMTQGELRNHKAMMIKCNALPPMQQNRVALVHSQDSTAQIFQTLQLDRTVSQGHARCLIRVIHPVQTDSWDTYEIPVFRHAQMLEGFFMALDLSDEDVATEDASTTDDEEAADSDESSLVSSMPFQTWQPETPIVYPWEDPNLLFQEEHEDTPTTPNDYAPRFPDIQALYQFLRAENDRSSILLITYGVGLVSIGRRDYESFAQDAPTIVEHIVRLWSDIATHGNMIIHLVRPQPNLGLARLNMVFIVEILYPEVPLNLKAILVKQRCADDPRRNADHYAAKCGARVQAFSLLTTLDIDEGVYPHGVRDFQVTIEGSILMPNVAREVEAGAYCEIMIGSYPRHIVQAQEWLQRAEALYIDIRSSDEAVFIPQAVCRFHGSSPQNNPLGHRDIVIDLIRFYTNDWRSEAVSLWPFPDQDTVVAYVFVEDVSMHVSDQLSFVFHFVVSYKARSDCISILVQQSIVAVEAGKTHSELKALDVPTGVTDQELIQSLPTRIFWTDDKFKPRIQRQRPQDALEHGSMVEINILTHFAFNIAAVLLDHSATEAEKEQENPAESISLLQISTTRSTNSGFEEIVQAIMHSPEDPDSDQSCLTPEPEGNSDLRREAAHENCGNLKQKERHGQRPVKISLEITLAQEQPEIDFQANMFQWFTEGSWADVIQTPWKEPLDWLPEGIHIHPSTWEALHTQSAYNDGSPTALRLYVDGATHQQDAGWSVVAIEATGTGERLLGVICGSVQTFDDHPQWIGATESTNVTAEVTAMIIAQAFAATQTQFAKIVICPDLTLSRQIAESKVLLKRDQTMSSLSSCLSQMYQLQTHVEEVRGHQGHPWNELADVIAKHAAKHGTQAGKVNWTVLNALAKERHDREWCWMQNATNAYRSTLPPMYENTVIQVPPYTQNPFPGLTKPQTFPHDAKLSLGACTANVLALDPVADGPRSGRIVRLDAQFHAKKIAVVGIQEARTIQGKRVTDHYNVYSTGGRGKAGKQHLGCELWLHRTQQIAQDQDGRKYTFNDFQIATQRADERRLIAILSGPIKLRLVVLHAPCYSSTTSIEEVESWWNETANMIRAQTCLTVVCCDANAPLADEETDLYSTHAAEEMNPQGFAFQLFLQTCELAVPSTFSSHSGDSGTWKHPGGKILRRDYVLVSQSLLASVGLSRVLYDVDFGFGHIDHFPAFCQIECAININTKPQRIKWDSEKLKCPFACHQFQEALKTLPMPVWQTDVDAHNAYLNQALRQIARQHFELKDKPKKQKPQLQEHTINLIGLKRDVLDMMRHAEGDMLIELREHLKALEQKIRPMVFKDQRKWYDDWVKEIDQADAQHDSAKVYAMLKRVGAQTKRKGGPKPLPLLRLEDGQTADSFQMMQEVWCRQFAIIEAGLATEEQDLIDIHLSSEPLCTDLVDLEMIPSAHQLASIINGLKNGRAAGPSQLIAEIYKAGSNVLVHHMLPLVTKALLWGREPLEWKGGTLVPLFKGRGSPANAEAYRSIFVADIGAKIHHKWIRRALVDTWQKSLQSLQMGGRPGVGVDLAHHILQMFGAWSREHNRSTAIVYLDLKAAFYSVLRGAVFGGSPNDQWLCLALKLFNVEPEDWHDIRADLENEHAVQGISAHAEAVMNDMFSPTFFQMAEISKPVMTTRGTRPGDATADVIFNLVFGVIMKNARQQFLSQMPFDWLGCPAPVNDIFDVPVLPSQGMLDLAFVDDATFAIYTHRADQLLPATQMLVSCVHDAARARGLEVNYGNSKTEVMMKPTGHGSRAVREKLWHKMDAVIPVITETGVQKLQIVKIYKHLGSYIQDSAAVSKEVQHRLSEARKAEGRIHQSFFAKKNVSWQAKVHVFRTLVMTRLLYNAHVWSWVGTKELQRLEDGLKLTVAAIAKPLLKRVPPYKISAKSMFAVIGLLPPSDQIHVNRLRYSRKIIKNAPQVLWMLLHDTHAENSWSTHLRNSVQWLKMHGPPDCRTWPEDFAGIITSIAVDDKFHAKVTKAKNSCLQYRRQNAISQIQHADFAITLERLGIQIEDPILKKSNWECLTCGAVFETRRGLAIHAKQIHGYKKKAKYWVLSDECFACGKKYWTRTRAMIHVQNVPSCFASYQACFPPASEEMVLELDEADLEVSNELKSQGWHPAKAILPVLKIPSAPLPPATDPAAGEMRGKWETRADQEERNFTQLNGRCLATGNEVEQNMPQTEALAYVGHSTGGTQDGHAGIFQAEGLSKVCAQITVRSRIFLHLYSGFRRHQDLQHYLESMTIEGQQIHCLSVDICMARQHSDLLCGQTVNFWKTQIRQGWIVGVGGGPPCETFTAARLQEGGPPPLRAYDHPWGLPSMTKRQWLQVGTGTALVFTMIELIIEAAVCGRAAFMEHPSFPVWATRRNPPSIWMWRILAWLQRLSCVQLTTFDQCVHGCQAKKPTTILTARLPHFQRLIRQRGHQGRCNHPGGHERLIGTDEHGVFKTQKAKIYPALLNFDLACSIREHLKATTTGLCAQEPDFLEDMQCHETVPLDIIQRDYHGWFSFSAVSNQRHCMIQVGNRLQQPKRKESCFPLKFLTLRLRYRLTAHGGTGPLGGKSMDVSHLCNDLFGFVTMKSILWPLFSGFCALLGSWQLKLLDGFSDTFPMPRKRCFCTCAGSKCVAFKWNDHESLKVNIVT